MAHLESLLLADANPRSREAIVFGFDREGVKVHALAALDQLGETVRARRPQLVIASLERAEASVGAAVLSEIGRLRDEPGTRDLPIVVVGERSAREESLRAGADEFISLPAFIRDVVTLSRLAVSVRQDGDGSGVPGLLDDYGLYFLARGLAVAGRSGVLELERAGRQAEVHFVRGEVVAAKLGKLTGVPAFHHLLLWQDATLHFRFVTPAGEREIRETTEHLLTTGATFARELEAAAQRVGGVRAVYQHEPVRAGRVKAHIPPEVQDFVAVFDGNRSLLDILEDSPFKPNDTVKVAFRLFQLGAIERRDAHRDSPQVTAQLAVRDWLLGVVSSEPRQTVTEAGRRAAEAYAEEEKRRSAEASPSDDLFVDTDPVPRVEPPVAVDHEAKTGPIKKVRRKRKSDLATAEGQERTERRKKAQPVTKERRAGERRKKKDPGPAHVDEIAVTTAFVRADLTPEPAPLPKATPREPEPLPKVVVQQIAPASPPASYQAKQMAFDDVEEAFFASEKDLHAVVPAENFDDLEATPTPKSKQKVPPKRSWFGLGSKKKK